MFSDERDFIFLCGGLGQKSTLNPLEGLKPTEVSVSNLGDCWRSQSNGFNTY